MQGGEAPLTLYKAPEVHLPFRENWKGPQQPSGTEEDCLEATGFVEEMVHTFLWKEARSRVRTYSRTGCTLHDPWSDCYREEKVTDISWWCAQ